jgi:hypothetical protein
MGCWLEGLNRTRWRLSRTVIRAALFSAALAIWLASGYMFLRNFGAAAMYECVEGLLPDAAESDGSARCGLRAICAEDAFGLLTDPGFDAVNDVGGSTVCMVMFAMLNGVAGPPVMLIAYLIRCIGRRFDDYDEEEEESKRPWMIATSCGLIQISTLAVGAIALGSAVAATSFSHREATVAFHVACRVVHVAMSSWRQHFDVNGYNLVWRIVRGWFNV